MAYILFIWNFHELINMIRQKVEATGCWLHIGFYSTWDDDAQGIAYFQGLEAANQGT